MDAKQDIAQRYDALLDQIGKLIAYSKPDNREDFLRELNDILAGLVEMMRDHPNEREAYTSATELFFILLRTMLKAAPRLFYLRGLMQLDLCNKFLLHSSGYLGYHFEDPFCANILTALVDQTCVYTLDFYRDNTEQCNNDDFATFYMNLKSILKSCYDNLRKVDPVSPFLNKLQLYFDSHDESAFKFVEIPTNEIQNVCIDIQPYYDGFAK